MSFQNCISLFGMYKEYRLAFTSMWQKKVNDYSNFKDTLQQIQTCVFGNHYKNKFLVYIYMVMICICLVKRMVGFCYFSSMFWYSLIGTHQRDCPVLVTPSLYYILKIKEKKTDRMRFLHRYFIYWTRENLFSTSVRMVTRPHTWEL